MHDKTAWPALDVLSPAARAAVQADAGTAYTRLVVKGGGSAASKRMLAELRPESLLSAPSQSNADEARVMLSGLWLWHDWLDESHNLSQAISTPTGSFWHAVMHRREGDFSNAKYWYARCRHHPALKQIATLARATLGAPATGPLNRLTGDEWDPDAFVDVVEATHRNPDDPLHPVAVRLQQLEWRGLFEHCLAKAAGAR